MLRTCHLFSLGSGLSLSLLGEVIFVHPAKMLGVSVCISIAPKNRFPDIVNHLKTRNPASHPPFQQKLRGTALFDPFRGFGQVGHLVGQVGSRTWCRPSLSGAAAKWSLPTRTPSSSTGWRMPRGSSDHGMDAARKSQKWLGWKEGVYLWLSSVWIEAGSHVERLSLDLMWTKALLERNNDRSGSNTMKQEISCATSRVWHTTPI